MLWDAVIFGGIGAIQFGAMSYYLYQTIQNVKSKPETALSKLFLHEESRKAFKILGISTITLSSLFTLKLFLDYFLGFNDKADYIVLLNLIPHLGFLYFYKSLSKLTEEQK